MYPSTFNKNVQMNTEKKNGNSTQRLILISRINIVDKCKKNGKDRLFIRIYLWYFSFNMNFHFCLSKENKWILMVDDKISYWLMVGGCWEYSDIYITTFLISNLWIFFLFPLDFHKHKIVIKSVNKSKITNSFLKIFSEVFSK